MVNVTKAAVEEFNKMMQTAEYPKEKMLRIAFGGYGWGGPKFRLTLDELKDETDIVEQSEGIKVVYAERFQQYLNGAVIDYSNNWFNRGFTIGGRGVSSC